MKKFACLFASLAALSLALSSRDVRADEATLTLRDALARVDASPKLRATTARTEAAATRVDAAYAAYYPTMTGTMTGSGAYVDRPYLPTPPVRLQSTTLGGDATLTARFPIYDFGRTSNQTLAASRGHDAAQADAKAARLAALVEVSARYFTVLRDGEAVEAARAVVAQRTAQLDIVRELSGRGLRPAIDRVRAEVALDTARVELTGAEADEVRDAMALKLAIGIDPLTPVRVTAVEMTAPGSDDPATAAAAATSRPELAAARAKVAQLEAQGAAVRARNNPFFYLEASGTVSHAAVLSGLGLPGTTGLGTVSAVLSWQFLDVGASRSARAVEADARAAAEEANALLLVVRTEAGQAAVSVRAARVQVERTELARRGSMLSREMAFERYRAGAGTMLELLDADASDRDARRLHVEARLAARLAQLRLAAMTQGASFVEKLK